MIDPDAEDDADGDLDERSFEDRLLAQVARQTKALETIALILEVMLGLVILVGVVWVIAFFSAWT